MASGEHRIDIVGRADELAAVHAFLAGLDRLPAGLVIHGQAGIGKTTLWRAAIASAPDHGYRVLSTRPAQAEMQLSYAGLADLIAPVLEEGLAKLPSPQRRALEVALVIRDSEGTPPEQAAIAFAFLSLLRLTSVEKPTLLAVDDLQWLDTASMFALTFAARRLRDDRVGFLVAVRPNPLASQSLDLRSWLSELPVREIHVGALSLGALNQIIHSRLDLVLPRPLLQRVHETSGGNPFFALELARALPASRAQLEAGQPLPVGGELRQLLRARIAALPEDTAETLVVVSALQQPTIHQVAKAVGVDPEPRLLSAMNAGLIELGDNRIRFSHPLFASAVYAATTVERRREIHRRLAEVVDDTDERARHLALGAEGPDESVASELENAARLARDRGAPQAGAEMGELAFRLTPAQHSEAAHRRRLDAGSAHFDAGDTGRARSLFEEAAQSAKSDSLRAEALGRLARLHHYSGDQRLAISIFRDCLSSPRVEASVRIDAAIGLATSLYFLREELADALGYARLASQTAAESGQQASLAEALGTQGMIEAVLGRAEAAETLQSALTLEESALKLPVARRPRFSAAVVGVWGDDLDSTWHDLEVVRDQAVAHGDENSLLPFVLTYLSVAGFLTGRWEDALREADAGEETALAAGQPIARAFPLSARALVKAGLGRETEARADAQMAIALAKRGTMFAHMTSLWALALLDLALERPGDVHRNLGPLIEHVDKAGIAEPGSVRFVADDIEALILLGEIADATATLDRFEADARRLGRRSALAASYRCRGLLAMAQGSIGDAMAEFDRSLNELAHLSLPLERARTLLGLGSAQRHARQRRVARETLEAALAAFDQLGASLWSERARTELRRVSGRKRSREDLTPTERRVAELVAEGRTNREVGTALFVTPRTVEGTLSRVYAKLGVRSRTELTRRLVSRLK